jgi:hypothetical protein
MTIVRVFPRKTSMTPTDPLAFVGDPPLGLWRPEADEVHISVAFTWDIPEAKRLRDAWANYYDTVRIGGPALDSHPNGFTPGKYVRPGVTFTTRGCDNRCPWCLVPGREGKLLEIDGFAPGYIIQDNNILQASHRHLEQVAAMLNAQRRAAVFSGGIQASLVDDWVAEWMRGLRVNSIFMAADTDAAVAPLRRAADKLRFLGRDKLRCYVLLAYDGQTIEQAEARLEAVWEAGCMPFAQLYQPDDHYIEYSREWRSLARTWSRPAAMKATHREG